MDSSPQATRNGQERRRSPKAPEDDLSPRGFTGAHLPIGIFLAAGPAIRHHARRLRLSVLDVAPLMMYLVGQPVPNDMEGQLQRALIDPDHLERHPPATIEAARAPRLPDDQGSVAKAGEDAETSEKLRALGYIQNVASRLREGPERAADGREEGTGGLAGPELAAAAGRVFPGTRAAGHRSAPE